MLKTITQFVGGWKSIATTAGIALLVGFGAGWQTNGWRLKSKDVKRLEASLFSATESARIAREGQVVTDGINATLRASLDATNDAMASISQSNAALAASRAPRVETVYREAKEFANATFDPASCPRVPVDERLLDYIWPPLSAADM
jgi:hypothetical protein